MADPNYITYSDVELSEYITALLQRALPQREYSTGLLYEAGRAVAELDRRLNRS